ncbi:MAG: SUMF1/EgtB/PvdO family nonheme iron enzyme [Oscillospiraceae bacterium]|jgi:hypothetical protein|nr:SUMF1/EgtB/PvdO family nonheme iron enzyme [Oscillospiraceae bacterium]MCI1989998.1 SUMF1/EgtB/PvdO family nonheme iron enzyme [Oscillospiraceae bacterium]MCI2034830.1 SUMF1/EgtB/PvdO family nonheme iron enzyme [Oscillospiraceae bacterium]
MSRYLTDDFINRDPRALLNTAKMAMLSDIVAPVREYLYATAAGELTVAADCIIALSGGGVFRTALTHLNAANLDTGSFEVGKDYYVYLCDPGSAGDEVYVISLNSTYPSGYNADTSRKIGGFHYGICRKVDSRLQPVNADGTVNGTGWESTVYDGIVPRSVWTLAHRPTCSPEGMTYLGDGTWADIYIASDDGAGGLLSAYNATPLTGTDGLNWYDFNERALKVGKRMLTYAEWCKAAYGSPQGHDADNSNAWSATTNTGRQLTGYVANAVSAVGCRDCVGDVWEWLDECITNAGPETLSGSGTFPFYDGSRAGQTYSSGNGHGTTGAWGYDTVSPFGGYGNIHECTDYSLITILGGGGWAHGSNDGPRTVRLDTSPWYVATYYGVRLGCEGT